MNLPDAHFQTGLPEAPLILRGKSVSGRIFAAPMAGLTHAAFRALLSHYGNKGLLFTEMLSAKALPTENPLYSKVFRWTGEELPRLVAQIVGEDPNAMARAAERVQKEGFFGVDLNFGCSAPGICKKGAGAALLRNPKRAQEIVRAVREAVECPVFVKFRTGWTDNVQPCLDNARRFEEAGADLLVFHPRVAPDRRTRPPKWDWIREVQEAVTIPVFGNGNVFSLKDLRGMATRTGCAGVSLGRVLLARPWAMAAWMGERQDPGPSGLKGAALLMADLCERHFEERDALIRAKNLWAWFSINFVYGHPLRKELSRAETMDRARGILEDFFRSPPPVRATLTPGLVF